MPYSVAPTLSVPRLPEEVDGIFVGAGHNALIAAAYLAKAGKKVLVLEAADRIGGGVVTEELTLPLFRHNPHAYFVRWTSDYRIWQDLDLDRYGVRSIMPEVQYGLAYGGTERALVMRNEVGPTLDSIREVSAADADAYARLFPRFKDYVVRILGPLYFAPPLPPDEERALLSAAPLGREYIEMAERSALDVIKDWFESEPLRALAAFICSVRGYMSVMDVPGTGYLPALALFTAHQGRMVEGGSGEVLRAIACSLYDAGGLVAANSPVASIDVRDGRAVGVTTEDGRVVRAREFVASSVPAPITLLEMVGRQHLDASLIRALAAYQWREEGLFGAHYALDRAPSLTAAKHDPGIDRSLNLALGIEDTQTFEAHIAALRAGETPDHSTVHGAVPTVQDPSQAPGGHHTAFGWEEVPARDAAGRASRFGEEANMRQVERMSETWERYAPGFTDSILAVQPHSPFDTASINPAMRYGDWHHGSYHPDNWGWNRPHPSLAEYRTPVDGLYLCGSSSHPGGSFSGMPGFNAAGAIADDLSAEAWWQRVDARKVLGSLADS